MSDPIKVGDLVMVVHVTHSCSVVGLGIIGTVTKILPAQWFRCGRCGKSSQDYGAAAELDCKPGHYAPLHWLRRIDPLSELESTEHKEETPA